MKYYRNILGIASILGLFCLQSCYKLQSDDELRQDIVGTWHKTECNFPNNTNPSGVSEPSPLSLEMTFHSDGSFGEGNNGSIGYCTFDTALGGISTCRWEIQEGQLMIIPDDPSSIPPHVLQEYPIKCLNGDRLVFDNADLLFLGSPYTVKKVCYQRQ